MTIHFFPKGTRQTASSRQRAYNVAAELSASGIATIVHEPFAKQFARSSLSGKLKLLMGLLRLLGGMKKGDIIFVQRAVYSVYFLLVLVPVKVLFRRKLVFDIDDAIYLHMPFRTRLLASLADSVVVGSHQLERWARKYNKSVYLIPTAIDFTRYSSYSSRHLDDSPLRIGWIGDGPAHYTNLQLLVPILQECVQRNFHLKLVIVGSLGSEKLKSLFNSIPGLAVEYIDSLDWSAYNIVPQTIQTFDVGVMPLASTSWNEGKCAFKAIEYMACAVPVLISDVGENSHLVTDGVNGFKAKTSNDWVDKIGQLISSRELRERLGNAGQATVREKYSYHVTTPLLISVLAEGQSDSKDVRQVGYQNLINTNNSESQIQK